MVKVNQIKGKIFLVPFGKQGTTDFLLTKTIEKISGNNFSDILYIGPTPRKIRDAQITFTKLVQSKSFIPPRFFTIKQFASEIFQEYSQDKRILSDFIKPLLVQKLKPDITIGYAQVLSEFTREIKQYLPDTSYEELKKQVLRELDKRGVFGYDEVQKQITDAIDLLIKYNDTLRKNNWVDSEDVSTDILPIIKDKLDIHTLVLDGFFYDLTSLEEKIVCALIYNAKKVFAISFFDSRTPEAYSLPQEFLTFLRSLNILEEEKLPELPEIRKDLPYYVCPSIEEEVETIASNIKKLFLDKNLLLNRSIVTFSRLSEYESLVRRTFTKYGIPHSIYTAKTLSKTQPVIAVLELLRSIINNYPRLSTVAVLSSPHFKRFSPMTKEWVGYYSKKGALIKDVSDWRGFGPGTISIMESEGEVSLNEKQIIEQIHKEINTFIALADKFKQPENSLAGYAQGLRRLLAQFEWCEKLTEKDIEIRTAKNEFYRVLDSIENFEAAFGKTVYSEDDFLRILDYFLDCHQIIPEVHIKGVAVLEFHETRGLDCDHLFFGGLSEDKFPGESRYDPVLPIWLKEKLKLPSLERHLARTKFHYFRLVNTARLDTFLSLYNTDEDRLLLPSPFLGNDGRTPQPFKIIFTEEQQQRDQGHKEKIDLTTLILPVNFSKDTEALKILSSKFGPSRKLSVTKLEQYPRCPYRFYLENVLDLSPLDEPRYEIEAKLWGSIAHEVLERLYQNKVVPIEKLQEELEKSLDAVLKEEELPIFWSEVTRRIFLNSLPYIMQIELEMRDQGFQPLRVEQYFTANIANDIKLSARIDRIDGQQSTNVVRILDYKTGTIPPFTALQVEIGRHLQLPIYAYIVKQNKPKLDIIDVGIYSLADNDVHWLVSNKNNINQLIEHAIKNAKKIVYHIRHGIFDLHLANDGDCRYCDYSAICPMKTTKPSEEIRENLYTDTPLFAE